VVFFIATHCSVPSALEMLHDNALHKFNIDIDIEIQTDNQSSTILRLSVGCL